MATDRGRLLGTYVDETLGEAVRVRAFEERCSKGEVLRRALRAYLGLASTAPGARATPDDPRGHAVRGQPPKTRTDHPRRPTGRTGAKRRAQESETP